MAVGVMVVAWKLAQKYWCPEKGPIPLDAFKQAELPEALLRVGLATELKDGIKMRGSEKHFAWWFERQEAGRIGGLASAKARRDKHGTAQPKSRSKPEAIVDGCSNDSEAKQPSSSFSSSYSLSKDLSLKQFPPNAQEPRTDVRAVESSPSGWDSPPALPKELTEPELLEFFRRAGVKPKHILLWVKTYQDPGWLKLEVYKMIGWLDANPHKRPRSNYLRFIGSWLGRGWEHHRKHLTSAPKEKQTNWNEVFTEEGK